jgi:hypothetical protein
VKIKALISAAWKNKASIAWYVPGALLSALGVIGFVRGTNVRSAVHGWFAAVAGIVLLLLADWWRRNALRRDAKPPDATRQNEDEAKSATGTFFQATWDQASARSFHLDQLKILRAKADKLHEESRATERYVLLGSGAIYTFVFAHWGDLHLRDVAAAKYIFLIPPILALLGGLRSWGLADYIRGCDDYIKKAEEALHLPGLEGWQHYWKDSPETTRLHHLVHVAKGIWSVTLALTLLIARIAWFE